MKFKQFILVLVPPLLLLSMLIILRMASSTLGPKAGYLVGFVFYWLVWCFAVPYLMLGKQGVINLLKKSPVKFRSFSWKEKLMLAVPLLLGYGYAFPKAIIHANIPIVVLSFVIALVNAVLEELLWRACYIRIFVGNKWLSIVYPALGFGLWHIAPLTVFPNHAPGATASFVAVATVVGLLYSFIAARYRSVYWTGIAHTLFDFSGLGARIYF